MSKSQSHISYKKMTETVVENEICPTCRTEMPADAVFCYKCGNSIKPEESKSVENQICPDCETEIPAEAVFCYHCGNSLKESEEKAVGQNKSKETELESAASLRAKARRLPPREVEVRWEEHENAPNVWFLGGAAVLTLFSLIIYFLAMYLR